MRPAALIDIDGTLVDSNYQHVTAWNRAVRAHGIVVPLRVLRDAAELMDRLEETPLGSSTALAPG